MAPLPPGVTELYPMVLAPLPVPDPVTTPALTANFVCRVVLGISSIIICLVPLRLLYRNGEFAAVVFVANMMGLNLLTVTNALIWRDDNMTEWWPGYGWCDLHPFLYVPMMALFTTSVLAISRNLSVQVGMLRAHPLTVREKRRKNLVQALIMFPLPLIQMAWIYPITAQRYTIATLVGCDWRVHRSWPKLVFFSLPIPVLALLSGYYAILTYLRYREVRKTTRGALSSNSSATSRQNRTRRRLYVMTICILIPYIPLQCAHAALNVMEALPLEPFDYHGVRNDENAPYPWNSILFRPSADIHFAFMNNKFISIATSVLVFFLFGATMDARTTYRRYLLAFGLGKLFPRLHEPSYSAAGINSITSPTTSWATRTDTTTTTLLKGHTRQSSQQLSRFGSYSQSSGTANDPSLHLPDLPLPEDRATSAREMTETDAPRTQRPSVPNNEPIPLPHRNPFLFRTHLDIHLPTFNFSIPKFLQWKKKSSSGEKDPDSSRVVLHCSRGTLTNSSNTTTTTATTTVLPECGPTTSHSNLSWLPHRERERISTRVWSGEEQHQSAGTSDLARRGEMSADVITAPDVVGPLAPSARVVTVRTHISQQRVTHNTGSRGKWEQGSQFDDGSA